MVTKQDHPMIKLMTITNKRELLMVTKQDQPMMKLKMVITKMELLMEPMMELLKVNTKMEFLLISTRQDQEELAMVMKTMKTMKLGFIRMMECFPKNQMVLSTMLMVMGNTIIMEMVMGNTIIMEMGMVSTITMEMENTIGKRIHPMMVLVHQLTILIQMMEFPILGCKMMVMESTILMVMEKTTMVMEQSTIMVMVQSTIMEMVQSSIREMEITITRLVQVHLKSIVNQMMELPSYCMMGMRNIEEEDPMGTFQWWLHGMKELRETILGIRVRNNSCNE